ncbi:MAG: hypothetical protein ABI147_05480 [Acidobacteriaceae bacterium]
MVARVQKTSEGYAIVLTEDALKKLKLAEGSAVEIHPVETDKDQLRPEIRYASTEDAMRAYRETLPQHEAAYRELAK